MSKVFAKDFSLRNGMVNSGISMSGGACDWNNDLAAGDGSPAGRLEVLQGTVDEPQSNELIQESIFLLIRLLNRIFE